VIEFSGKGILLDIEGTTSSVSYVYDVLFPYARKRVEAFLEGNWRAPAVQAACDLIARDAGAQSMADWCGDGVSESQARGNVVAEVYKLMDADVKATGLKELQGIIWKEGFEKGELQSHVYPDVAKAFEAWRAAGLDLRIFSSGSVAAQRMLFAHSRYGNLGSHLQGYYDTRTGPKKEPSSYAAIAADMNLEPEQLLFLSDVVAELDAAGAAGFTTGLVARPGNAPAPPGHGHPVITDFEQVNITN